MWQIDRQMANGVSGKDCEGRNGREVDSEGEECSVRDCDPVDGAWTAWSRERQGALKL